MTMTAITRQCEKFYQTIRHKIVAQQMPDHTKPDYPPLSDEELALLANDLFLELDQQEAQHG
jgi:hypothetical protein